MEQMVKAVQPASEFRDTEGDAPAQAVPSLRGRVALVTGGGRGLGEALCQSLAEAGAAVIAADVNHDNAQSVAERLRGLGASANALALDVADETQTAAALDEIMRTHGRIDFVINNAGIDKTVSVEELSVAEWERILAVNLTGPFIMSRAVFPILRQQGRGHIVNIVSTAAKRAWPNASAYHASKYGLLGLSYALHTEGRPHGIKVTAVISGGLRTPFLLDRFPDIDINNLQEPRHVADTVRFVLTQPPETVIPEVMVLPMRETSWP
jgi:NAD(P)-dependent dehydrogenase (short-subunit alcohol dehydrogenase family)